MGQIPHKLDASPNVLRHSVAPDAAQHASELGISLRFFFNPVDYRSAVFCQQAFYRAGRNRAEHILVVRRFADDLENDVPLLGSGRKNVIATIALAAEANASDCVRSYSR